MGNILELVPSKTDCCLHGQVKLTKLSLFYFIEGHMSGMLTATSLNLF